MATALLLLFVLVRLTTLLVTVGPHSLRCLDDQMKSTLERNGKEAVVTYSKILTQYMSLKLRIHNITAKAAVTFFPPNTWVFSLSSFVLLNISYHNKIKITLHEALHLFCVQLDHDSVNVCWAENRFGQIVATWYERFVV